MSNSDPRPLRRLTTALGLVLVGGSVASHAHSLAAIDDADPGQSPSETVTPPQAVTLEIKGERHRLLRGGEPYFVKGAGGRDHLDQLVAAGGNSIRTWGVDGDTERLLDAAHREGLTVTLGIWLEHGLDYADERAVDRQVRKVRDAVERFKEHPALLVWGIGNEMEGDGSDPRVYEHIDALAKMVAGLDPDHPTMTVIAEMGPGGKKIKDLDRLAPSIDIVGINSYGAVESVPQRYRRAGGRRPYIVTELGPEGHWESARTSWGSPVESSSTEKAKRYRAGYEKAVLDQPLCLGAYAFLWGQKQETTATWYGMFLADGTRLAAVDTMTELWSGKRPSNRSPKIKSLESSSKIVRPGTTFDATLVASDPDRDDLEVEWVLRAASTRIGSGGAYEDPLPAFPRAIVSAKARRVKVRAPDEEGPYRLFVYVRDGQGNGAVHNVPLLVKH